MSWGAAAMSPISQEPPTEIFLGDGGLQVGQGLHPVAQSRHPAGLVCITGAQLGTTGGDGGQSLLSEEETTGLAYPLCLLTQHW